MHMVAVWQVANELTNSMGHGTARLKQFCLQLNASKTGCMFFTEINSSRVEPGSNVFVSGERLQVICEYKYLGVLIDSKLSYKAQVKFKKKKIIIIINKINPNLICQISGSFKIILELFVIFCHSMLKCTYD